MTYYIDKRLTELSVNDLPLQQRQQLCSYLNIEQVLMSDCGLARDYRGLAQQLNLSYSEIGQFEKHFDPCGTLLNHNNVKKLTVYDLCEFILTIERYDILDDMIPLILEELNNLKNRQNNINNNNTNNNRHHNQQQNEIIPHRPLTPVEEQSTIWYDAYVCYADSDLEFVQRLAGYLESPQIGFRLFIRDRDLLIGNWVYETFARLIETQCRRMIIILSPEFLQCHECKFQSLFAAGLAIEKRSRILIPIIYKPCKDLPSMLRLMSKIDMTGSTKMIPEWSMRRLVMSIQKEESAKNQVQTTKAIEYSNQNTHNNNNNHNNNNRPNLPLFPLEEQVSTNDNSNRDNSQKTQISVISNESTSSTIITTDPDEENESTQLIMKNNNKKQDQQTTSTTINEKHIPSTVTTTTATITDRSKNWIKSIKKKIKVAL